MRRFGLSEFDESDGQGPDVAFFVVGRIPHRFAHYYFGRHPERGSDECEGGMLVMGREISVTYKKIAHISKAHKHISQISIYKLKLFRHLSFATQQNTLR